MPPDKEVYPGKLQCCDTRQGQGTGDEHAREKQGGGG